jgi:hypothetical protein
LYALFGHEELFDMDKKIEYQRIRIITKRNKGIKELENQVSLLKKNAFE